MLLDLYESDLKEMIGFLQARNIKKILNKLFVGVEQEKKKTKVKEKPKFYNTCFFGDKEKDNKAKAISAELLE